MHSFLRTTFTAAIFTGALLLFLVQPMVGKMLLPKFGGTPAVWNTCMVFFQFMLLAGYVYAHLGDRWLGSRKQAVLHLLLLVVAAWFLPFELGSVDMQKAASRPAGTVLRMLTLSLGVPFFCLAATAPLLQKWFSETDDPRADDPYFLYAASNAGSLLALLAYPLLIEAWTTLDTQTHGWSVGFGVQIALIAICVTLLYAAGSPSDVAETKRRLPGGGAVDAGDRLQWVLYAFIPSSLMLGVTTFLTTDIAAVPLLWVLPFVLYLGTYIVAFSDRMGVPQALLVRVAPLAFVPLLFFFAGGHRVSNSAWLIAGVHLLGFGLVALIFHQALARRRPPTTHLTEFYFWVALGGMFGGLFNALLAPVIFNWPLEYPLVLAVAALALPVAPLESLRFDRDTLVRFVLPALAGTAGFAWALDSDFGGLFWAVIAVFGFFALIYMASHRYRRLFGFTFAIAVVGAMSLGVQTFDYRYMKRNFFGSNAVMDAGELRYLFNGAMIHGAQYLDEERADLPVPYYLAPGPIRDVFEVVHDRPVPQPVALIGLGTGSLATYGRDEQPMTFFEIDPDVVEIAREHFTFLGQSSADIDIVVGDGRLGLREQPSDKFGLVVVDAFSADAIPTHLATLEALMLYFDRMHDQGILLFHVSNKYVDLRPVLANIAAELDMVAYSAVHHPSRYDEFEDVFAEKTVWVAIARNEEALGKLSDLGRWRKQKPEPDGPVWTDDYSNIVRVLR